MPSERALERKLKRESASRKEAETLLEKKSLELFYANQQLQEALKQLETKSQDNIRIIEFREKIDSILIHFGNAFFKKHLDDILIAELSQRLTDNDVVKQCKIHIKPTILPNLTKGEYGDKLFDTSQFPLTQDSSFWSNDVLIMPLEVEEEIIGSIYIQTNDFEKDSELIESQIALVAELLCSAITRYLQVARTEDSRQRAEASERSTRDFLAMINHELRTPLNGLLGSAELLNDTHLDEHQKELCNNLKQSGEFLRVIINDLLDYSKINAGMMELIPSSFSWADLNQTLTSIFRNRALEKQINFAIDVSPNLPQQLHGDLERLTQIFVNLIGNAIKFTEQGGVNVFVNWVNQQLVVSIKDTGIGISEKAQITLFQPFIQADSSSSRNYEGTGLGLAICKQLVELMQGNIVLTSTLGKGSEFVVTLPIIKEDVTVTPVQQAQIPADEFEDYSFLKALVVDDIKMNQIIIGKMLAKFKIKPDVVDNGLKAVNATLENDYDVIFMDCRMPVMDGFTATQKLREQGYNKPILAVTAGTTLEEREKCISVGMNDIITKPYTAKGLQALLKLWIKA